MIVRPNNPHNRLSVIPDYAKNQKKTPFSTVPSGNSPQSPKNRPFLTQKRTFFVIFSSFFHKYLSEPQIFGTVIFVSPRQIHSNRPFDPPYFSIVQL